ncbi:MAG: Lrp/AsnC family transcriptional regulator [Hyphomicrobiales bacterium]|nr:Lrp/AsnC family transcriptional regulator [Hyphomicrobiales bacterium]MCP4999846.1 Lrp/AsnC family transcriptional regulator [Hyphomicrobiales bacterium]
MSIHANIDEFDRKIISILQRDGRISNVDLADKVGLSPSPCLRRVRILEERGIIKGYGAVVDRNAIGLDLTVFVQVSVSQHSRKNAASVQQRLNTVPGSVSCHMVSGNADFLLELVVPSLAAYERLLTEQLLTMEEISDIRSNFSLRPVRVDGSLDLSLL